jgi:hypothetical protein
MNVTRLVDTPDAGHNLSLHPNARLSYDRMADWLAAQGLI